MTTEAPKIVTATPADIRAYFAFRAFQIGSEGSLPVVEIGENPFAGCRNTRNLYPQRVSREELLKIDQAMEPWRTADRKLVKKAYLFNCDQCDWGSCEYDAGFNPPGQDQACQGEEADCVETPYEVIPAISWSAEQLLADPEARESDIDIDFIFRKKPDGRPFFMEFTNEYFRFIGANLASVVGEAGHNHVYHVTMKPTDATRITGTEGLIAEMRFHGKSGLFLPESSS